MKIRLPWQKRPEESVANAGPCHHPRADVEMVGTVVKRRWCTVCGADLPVLPKLVVTD